MRERFKCVEVKIINTYHFKIYEGKFKDTKQHGEVFVYASISNLHTKKYEDSDVSIYAHSYTDLYDAYDYEICGLYDYSDLFKEMILANI